MVSSRTGKDDAERTAVSTFDRVAIDLSHEAFPEMAAALGARNRAILTHWRERSLRAMPHLDALTLAEFENTIGVILSSAAEAFASADPQALRGVMQQAPLHGIHRFVQDNSVLDLFEEVRILRGVVIIELAREMKRALRIAEAATFHAIFDIIIQQGVMALVQKRSDAAQPERDIMREMNAQLMMTAVRISELVEEARNSEAALRASEQRYRTLFNAMDQGYCIIEVIFDQQQKPIDFRYLHVNAAFEKQSGRHGVVAGKRQTEFVPSIDEHWLQAYGQVAMTGEPVRLSNESKELGRWFEAYAFRAEGWGERAVAVLFNDITQRKRVEEVVARLASIVTSSDDAIISKDLNGVITTWNRGAERVFGYTAEEVIGKPVTLLIPEDQLHEAPQILERIRRGEPIEHYETVRRRKDGTLLNISLTVSPIKDDAGNVTGASKVARDITERVAMENRIKQQAEALADESRRKDEFLAMLSHELRNPLAPIRSAVHVLRTQERSGEENPIQKQAREIIERQVGNLTKLVSDLLQVSRVVSGRIRLDQQVVDLNQLVSHAIETARPLIEQRRHELVLNPCARGVWVNADATRLEEVIINLLDNAAKYTLHGGKIEVWCEHSDSGGGANLAQVRVRDNGMGIDAEILPRIFDLFTQADRSLEHSAGGLGVGLSLAHRLVEMHGGTIEAKSDGSGTGAEFIVRLPLAPPPQDMEREREAPQRKLDAGTRVLIVDDNIDLVLMLASSLRQKGYSVQSAYTGPDGLKVAQQWRPDIILLDIGLPGMNGYEVARRIRADKAPGSDLHEARLIALTGYGRDADLALAREAGFDAHLVKPYEFDELEELMNPPAKPDNRGSAGEPC